MGVSPRHSLNAGFAEAVQKHGAFKTTRKNTSNTIEGYFSGVKAELRSKRGMLVSVAYAFGRRQSEASDRSRPEAYLASMVWGIYETQDDSNHYPQKLER